MSQTINTEADPTWATPRNTFEPCGWDHKKQYACGVTLNALTNYSTLPNESTRPINCTFGTNYLFDNFSEVTDFEKYLRYTVSIYTLPANNFSRALITQTLILSRSHVIWIRADSQCIYPRILVSFAVVSRKIVNENLEGCNST